MTSTLKESIARAKADASIFVKIESNQSVRLHIIGKARAFSSLYFKVPPYPNAPKNFVVPFGTQIPGYKFKAQWAFPVVDLASGAHKILCCGSTVAGGIDKADEAFRPKGQKDVEGAGYPLLDILLSKTGELLGTKWTVTPAPTEYEGDGITTVDMDAEIEMTSAEELAKLTANRPKSTLIEGAKAGPSDKQVDFIDSLCKSKELTVKAVNDLIMRKFGKASLSDLSGADAGVLIETIQGM